MARIRLDIWCNQCEEALLHKTALGQVACGCTEVTVEDIQAEEMPEQWPVLDLLAYFTEE